MKTKQKMSLITAGVAILLAVGAVALKADCPGQAQPGGKCTASSPATPGSSQCSTYTVNWTCDSEQYPLITQPNGSQSCNTSAPGKPAGSSNGSCTLTTSQCSN